MAKGDRAIWNVSGERLLIFGVLHVLSLVGNHLFIEDLTIDVTKKQELVEFQLWVDVQGTSGNLGTIREDFLGFLMLGLHTGKVLRVSEVQANGIL